MSEDESPNALASKAIVLLHTAKSLIDHENRRSDS